MNADKKPHKSSVSDAKSYQEMGEYWDTHDLSETWDRTEPAEFAVDASSRATYYPVESTLSEKLHVLAARRGVSAQTLLNLWLQEKVTHEAA